MNFVRASGPGGQNVNKVATTAQLRFHIRGSAALDTATKRRMILLAGRRVTPDGMLVIEAGRYRTQIRNRADALARFQKLLDAALKTPRSRIATKASAASKERRLRAKRTKSTIKRLRANREES